MGLVLKTWYQIKREGVLFYIRPLDPEIHKDDGVFPGIKGSVRAVTRCRGSLSSD